ARYLRVCVMRLVPIPVHAYYLVVLPFEGAELLQAYSENRMLKRIDDALLEQVPPHRRRLQGFLRCARIRGGERNDAYQRAPRHKSDQRDGGDRAEGKQTDPLARRTAKQPEQGAGDQRQESAAGRRLQNQENAVDDPAPRRQLERFGLGGKRKPDQERQYQD